VIAAQALQRPSWTGRVGVVLPVGHSSAAIGCPVVLRVDGRCVILDRKPWLASARRVAPFAGACCLAWVAVLVGSSITWWEYVASFALAWAAGGVALVAIIARRHQWLAVVPSALLLLGAVGLLRQSAGGIASGAGALAILPVFQTALYSRSRRDLLLVLAGVALFYLIPIWAVAPRPIPTPSTGPSCWP